VIGDFDIHLSIAQIVDHVSQLSVISRMIARTPP
jgi:hypothetical protein